MQKMLAKANENKLYHILHFKHQKNSFFNTFRQFLIFGKIQDGAQTGSHLG